MNHSIETAITSSSSGIPLDVPMSMRPMTPIHQSFRYCIVVFGTLVNLLVIVVIRYSRQLHYPRHLFWAAISLVNQCFIVQVVLEVVAIVHDNQLACRIFVLNAGVFYTIVLSFLTLAALDRYLAIARYEWYKNKVTNRGVIYVLSFVCSVTYAAITSPFWTGFKNISNCTVNITHMHCVMIYDLLLGFMSVILHAMIFIRSRAAISKQPPNFPQTPIALQFRTTHSANVVPEGVERTEGNQLQEENPTLEQTAAPDESQHRTADAHCFTWFFNRPKPKLSRLEIQAALSMSINVLPVWLCTFPVTINAIVIYWCIRLEESCPVAFRINPYFTDLFFIQTIYNPLMYMLTSKEFKRAVVHLKQKCKL